MDSIGLDASLRGEVSVALTFITLFALDVMRGIVTKRRWCKTGLEVLGLGALAGAVAYFAGSAIARMTGAA